MACKHTKYSVHHKMEYVTVFLVEELVLTLTISCVTCGQHYVFKGEAGFSTSQPMTSADASTLRIPLLKPIETEKKRDDDGPNTN